MQIRRVVPDLSSADPQRAAEFYTDVIGLRVVMDHGWIVGLGSPSHPNAQLQLMSRDESAAILPAVSIEVEDVDTVHAEAVRRGLRVVHPLTDEPWGVRRFFVQDPDGHVINVLTHRGQASL